VVVTVAISTVVMAVLIAVVFVAVVAVSSAVVVVSFAVAGRNEVVVIVVEEEVDTERVRHRLHQNTAKELMQRSTHHLQEHLHHELMVMANRLQNADLHLQHQ
jgi:cytochrome c-type biogenesis protein CcmH/NrfG